MSSSTPAAGAAGRRRGLSRRGSPRSPGSRSAAGPSTPGRGKAISEPQRRRWVALLLDALDEAELPADPEFRAAVVGYLEWGTRLALADSQPGAQVVRSAPVLRWGWGVAPPWLG